tara:strand:+ start:804 stop:1310 length:507 start_codon:yes stop_codon:yes gene_type:complete
MEYNLTITLSEGEDLISRLKQAGLNLTGPLSLTLVRKQEATTEVIVVETPTLQEAPAKKTKRGPRRPRKYVKSGKYTKRGRGRPRKYNLTEDESGKKTTPKVKKTTKAKRGKPVKAKPWTKKQEIWVASQPKPSASSGIEVLFKDQFGMARTPKAICAKWRRLHGLPQ